MARLNLRKARSNFTASQTDQSEALSLFQPTTNNERAWYQGSPELFSPSVIRKIEELWGREWRKMVAFFYTAWLAVLIVKNAFFS